MPKLKSEIRKDYFLDKYVLIAPGRAKRPLELLEKTIVKEQDGCDFCPGKLPKNKIIASVGEKGNWQIASIKNIFPVLSLDNPRAYGRQEVIIETPRHGLGLAELSVSQIEKLLKFYAARTASLSKIKNIDYVLVFKNSGAKAGASRLHAHSQIFATKFLPPDILKELTEAKSYRGERGSCPYCDIIKKEEHSARRIYTDKQVVAFTPVASEQHFEAWIFTRRHLDNITRLTEAEFSSFAKALKQILSKLNKLKLDYNFFMHQVVSDTGQHFYLKIQPRDNIWGGVELGSGLIINSVSPEEAAKFYRA
jgi:UDPglucose--hexose-1-phosphate uridylyltransferase